MNKIWSDDAWEDYLYWQSQNKKTLKRINQLIKEIERNDCMIGIGKPEALTGDLQGEFSRRINDKDRLVITLRIACFYVHHGKLSHSPPIEASRCIHNIRVTRQMLYFAVSSLTLLNFTYIVFLQCTIKGR